MFSAKWQRHSTFLSVRWRTWIGRALMASSAFLASVGVGLLASGNGSSGGASTGRPVAAPPHGKRAGFQPATWRRPVSYQAARGQLTAPSATAAADRDICEVVGGVGGGGGGGGLSGVSAPGASA